MSIASTSQFDELCTEEYLNKEEYVHAIGLHLDKTVLELAYIIFEKEHQNESKKH